MAFDFDRAAHIMAALSSKPVSPRSLNPYRAKRRGSNYTVDDCQRMHRVRKAGGHHVEQVVTMENVVHHDID